MQQDTLIFAKLIIVKGQNISFPFALINPQATHTEMAETGEAAKNLGMVTVDREKCTKQICHF